MSTTTTSIRIDPGPRPGRILRLLGGVINTIVMALVAAFVLFAILTRFGVIGAWDVETGSMSGYANPGDLVITHDTQAADLRIGDVITVPKPNLVTGGSDGKVVTHRIAAIEHHGLTATIRIKGDRNAAADWKTYDLGQAQRAIYVVHGIGAQAYWAFHKGLIYLVLLFVFGAIAYNTWPRKSERFEPTVTVQVDDEQRRAVTDDADVQPDVDPALLARIRRDLSPLT